MINMQPSASPCIMWPSWTTWSVEDSSFVARWLALIIIPPLSLGPAYGILWLQCYWPFCLWCSPPLKDLMLRNMTHRANDHSLCCVDLYDDPCVCHSTYIYIIKTILQFLCLQQKKKTFSTCSSHFTVISITSVQFGSVTQLCLTLWDPMNRSRPGLPVHHQLPEFTQTHVHWVGDAIQPPHPLSSPSPAPNPSQHQDIFQWVNSSLKLAKVLEFQLQHQSFQWVPRTDLL